MVISLLVLLVPVILLVSGYQLLSGRTQPVAVDPAPALADARAAGLAVAVPGELDAGWVPVSAVFRSGDGGLTLRLGYLTPAGASVQLVQSSIPADRLLAAELPDASTLTGAVEVAGHAWQRYSGTDRHQALVLLAVDQTTIALGAASEAELQALAASLRPS
jgi:hypothetical protein